MKLSLDVKGTVRPDKHDVVLIHGTGSHSGMWSSQVETLVGSGHRCFSPDLRGHGRSGELYETTNLDKHIEDILETIDTSDIRFPAVFVGHSLGSIISLKLAMQSPEVTKRLFLAALPGRVYKPVTSLFKVFLKGGFQTMKSLPIEGALHWRQKALLETDLHSLNEIVNNFADLDLVASSLTVECPVHLSAGRFDPVAPIQHVQKIHKSIPHSTLKVYDFGGHNFMDYHKESFNQWIKDHLESEP